MEPEFIEVFGREVYHPEMIYDTVIPEVEEGMMRAREAGEKRKENHLSEAQPITLLGNLLLAKNFKVEENDVVSDFCLIKKNNPKIQQKIFEIF